MLYIPDRAGRRPALEPGQRPVLTGRMCFARKRASSRRHSAQSSCKLRSSRTRADDRLAHRSQYWTGACRCPDEFTLFIGSAPPFG